MSVALSPFYAAAVRATLAVANAHGFDRRLLLHTADGTVLLAVGPGRARSLPRALGLPSRRVFVATHAHVRETLAGLVDAPSEAERTRRAEAAAVTANRALEGVTYMPFRLQLRADVDTLILPTTWPRVIALGVLLIATNPELRARLGQCGAPGCGHFNLALNGRAQRHCSAAHRLAFESTTQRERTRRWKQRREKRAAEAGAPRARTARAK